jgi:hypothetical protein
VQQPPPEELHPPPEEQQPPLEETQPPPEEQQPPPEEQQPPPEEQERRRVQQAQDPASNAPPCSFAAGTSPQRWQTRCDIAGPAECGGSAAVEQNDSRGCSTRSAGGVRDVPEGWTDRQTVYFRPTHGYPHDVLSRRSGRCSHARAGACPLDSQVGRALEFAFPGDVRPRRSSPAWPGAAVRVGGSSVELRAPPWEGKSELWSGRGGCGGVFDLSGRGGARRACAGLVLSSGSPCVCVSFVSVRSPPSCHPRCCLRPPLSRLSQAPRRCLSPPPVAPTVSP